MISMGDVTNLSSTAAVLLKISVFSAWAEMQGASGRHAPLKSLLEPYLADLCTFWLATLREYARLRVPDTESMNGNSMTSNTVSLDSFGSTLTREVALPVSYISFRLRSSMYAWPYSTMKRLGSQCFALLQAY